MLLGLLLILPLSSMLFCFLDFLVWLLCFLRFRLRTTTALSGHPTNREGRLIDSNGSPLGCEFNLSNSVDENGDPIPPEEVLGQNSDGTFPVS